MHIGKEYAANRIYRGIKHSNGLPLLAEDLHEFSDTLVEKSKYLLDNIVGSGMLNNIVPYITDTGIRLQEPAVLNISGDICLVQTSADVDLVALGDMKQFSSGTVVILGWYQNITANSTMREYGGVINGTLENNLLYVPLNIQVSSRYQFRWVPLLVEGSLSLDSILSFSGRDEHGDVTNTAHTINIKGKSGSVYFADAPEDMDYAVDGLYCIPLIEYVYDAETDTFLSATSYPSQKTSAPMLESETEPVGTHSAGTIWYNPVNSEFRIYVEGKGFVSTAPQMGFVQYQYVNIETTDSYMAGSHNLSYIIDENSVPTLLESDIIRVTYEGLELSSGVDYTINVLNRTITLLNFTRIRGEKLVVTITRLIEANNVTSLTETLINHMSEDSHVLTDTATGDRYRISITNGEIVLLPVV